MESLRIWRGLSGAVEIFFTKPSTEVLSESSLTKVLVVSISKESSPLLPPLSGIAENMTDICEMDELAICEDLKTSGM